MVDFTEENDRRRYPRVGIAKTFRAKSRETIVEGAVADVSVGAIKVRSDVALPVGQEVHLQIEDLSPVAGRVSRILDDGFIVALGLGREDEDRLIAEIMQIQNNIRAEGR